MPLVVAFVAGGARLCSTASLKADKALLWKSYSDEIKTVPGVKPVDEPHAAFCGVQYVLALVPPLTELQRRMFQFQTHGMALGRGSHTWRRETHCKSTSYLKTGFLHW